MIRTALLAVCAVLFVSGPAQAATPPVWVRDAMASPPPAETAAAVVLLDEIEVTITTDGRMRARRRYAVRLHDQAGREAAAIREVYLTGTGRIQVIRGWLVRPDASVRELGNRDAVDTALVNNDVFNEVRVRGLSVSGRVAPGDVFAAEVESEDQLLFAQIAWQLQGRWPARMVRRVLTLPAHWGATSVTFNAPPLAPRQDGASLTWESRDVPAVPDEEGMPPVTDLAPRLAVSIFGPMSGAAPGQFSDWTEVSSWLDGLAAGSQVASLAVAEKARMITASASTTFERVAAIARYAQRVQYVSIQTGVGRGGGYAPRPAAVVMERNYGDCKDKAALMRVMLASIGVQSHFVSVFAGDRNYVRAVWPSPQQFNHVVLGIAIDHPPPGVTSTISDSRFGRLMLFDPTDEHVPLGELPLSLQGSLGLIVAPSGGALVPMPMAPASHHAIERTIEGSVSAEGTLSAGIRERSTGSLAVAARAEHAILGSPGFESLVERRFRAVLSSARVEGLAVENDGASPASFVVTAQLAVSGFAQIQARLLVLPLPFDLGGRLDVPASRERRTPVLLEPRVVTERVRLRLPAGFAVDELPPALTLDTPFGRYSAVYAVDAGDLTAVRSLVIPLQTVQAEQYPAARAFFERVRAADQAPVVLVSTSR